MSRAEKGSFAAALVGIAGGVLFMAAGSLMAGLFLAIFAALLAAQVCLTASYHRMFDAQRRSADSLAEELMVELRQPSRL